MNEQEKLSGCAAAVVGLAILPVAYVVWALAFAWTWSHFVRLTFPGAPAISPAVAVGLASVISLLRSSQRDREIDEAQGWALTRILFRRALLAPLTSWLVAFIAWRLV